VELEVSSVPQRRAYYLLVMTLLCANMAGAHEFHVSPMGSDQQTGTKDSPFRTLQRAQQAAREAIKTATSDVVVSLAEGVYRLENPLEFDLRDSGRDGHRVVYRSVAGPGKARILGSRTLRGWQQHTNRIWKLPLPEGWVFHTMYENGQRVHKARFPNLQEQTGMPTALGRYLVSEHGSPELSPGQNTGWLVYRPGDESPATHVQQMKIAVFPWGKCNWHRYNYGVRSIDPSARRLTFDTIGCRTQIQGRARYFLEDELAFLDAPGEFYLDESARVLYYIPIVSAHPDQLNITAPCVKTLLRICGESAGRCVENLSFIGLALEETDDLSPVLAWWNQEWGAQDFALVWMRNAARIEIRRCHLRNSGRNGVMMVGHNTDHFVEGCWIEQMAVNGVTLSNRFLPPNDQKRTTGVCQRNRIVNCRIHDVGQLHIYAACVNVMSASDNEIAFCELYNSSRYATTMRGNTNAQHVTPHSFTRYPPARGNSFHHLRIHHCGQDSGDMGAIHTATLNIPGGDCVNCFEQITIADTEAIPSMQDIPPDGIFLDWPFKSMHQVFRHLHIERAQGWPIRGNGPENVESATTENVSWNPDFRETLMDFGNIGLTSDFPPAFGGRSAVPETPPAPRQLTAIAPAWDRVGLSWQPPEHAFSGRPRYFVYRDSKKIAVTDLPTFEDRFLDESTVYRYSVAVADGEFAPLSEPTRICELRTPADSTPPRLDRAVVQPETRRIRVLFSKPVDAASATKAENWNIQPTLDMQNLRLITPTCVEIEVVDIDEQTAYRVAVKDVVDTTLTRNAVSQDQHVALRFAKGGASYTMTQTADGRLLDSSGSGRDARLHGSAVVDPTGGPHGAGALITGRKGGYAEAPADLDVGGGDFTLTAWIWKSVPGSAVIVSKGNGFGASNQWSWGWEKEGVPGSISLRAGNVYSPTARDSVPLYRWVHVAFVRRGDTGQSYVDGRLSGAPHDMTRVGSLVNDQPLRIGRRAHEPNPAYFRGKIGPIRILPVALTADEILAEQKVD